MATRLSSRDHTDTQESELMTNWNYRKKGKGYVSSIYGNLKKLIFSYRRYSYTCDPEFVELPPVP
jgi:hypothetical protein